MLQSQTQLYLEGLCIDYTSLTIHLLAAEICFECLIVIPSIVGNNHKIPFIIKTTHKLVFYFIFSISYEFQHTANIYFLCFKRRHSQIHVRLKSILLILYQSTIVKTKVRQCNMFFWFYFNSEKIFITQNKAFIHKRI